MSPRRTAEELDQLLAPIALYPDALIALILPASAAPTDIVLAARHLRDNPNDRSQIEHRAWDESVKSLTHYAEVLRWMDENLPWTKQVGEAFIEQPADVMQSIQRLRAKARAAGTLVDTPQQQVLAEPEVIRIVPAQPDYIYVPRYEPEVVFIPQPIHYVQPLISFGAGVRVGSWLAHDCDWRKNTIWMGDRHRRWTGHDWRRPVVSFHPGFKHGHATGPRQWHPPVRTHRPGFSVGPQFRREIARPIPLGAPRPIHSRTFTGTTSPSPHAHTRSFTPHSRSGFVGPRPSSEMPTQPQRVLTQPSLTNLPAVSVPAGARRSPSDWTINRGTTTTRTYQPSSRAIGPQPATAPTTNRVLSMPSRDISPARSFQRSAPAPVMDSPAAPVTAARPSTPELSQPAPARSEPAASPRGGNAGERAWRAGRNSVER